MLAKIRVLVPLLQGSQPFLRSFSGNDMNVLVVLLWMSNAFPLDRLKEKLAIACYLNLATENDVWHNR